MRVVSPCEGYMGGYWPPLRYSPIRVNTTTVMLAMADMSEHITEAILSLSIALLFNDGKVFVAGYLAPHPCEVCSIAAAVSLMPEDEEYY
jgi:hypothetical protein